MLNQIAMGLGGRVAEELVLNDISSGAASSPGTLPRRSRKRTRPFTVTIASVTKGAWICA